MTVTAGPNDGDVVGLEVGSCRLIGRHLSETETAFIDRDGNRVLDSAAAEILSKHLKERAPDVSLSALEGFSASAFDRGPDIIFADDSISRAHAMVFYDAGGLGIIDLASTNGTFINTERIGSALIADGDVIAIGNSELAVKIR
ncbi:MAG: FHA domain-containing protein [Clostridia bacterium]|nr:FHA domain-containing protein [Deltaproteobacteria bacterium]